ncbi:hypothetical protein [Streptomyces sp. NPDC055912]|uniref:hypothetical protein n=1 Tax=Streptomyces sp. NPDC055912 TaxID=3345660 RepID=UPI0035D6BA70
MGAIEDLVEAFVADLRRLRHDVGQPSFRELESHARKAGTHLPASTASDAVRGRRLPKLPVVIAFVLACRKYAEEAKIPMPDKAREMYAWQRNWATASAASGVKEDNDTQDSELSPRPSLRPASPVLPGRRLHMPNRHGCSYLLIADNGGESLSGVHSDVENMIRGLEAAAPWMAVTTCLNPTYEKAQEAVRRAVETPSDLLVLHVLGHGYLNESARLSLPLTDTVEDDLSHTALDLEGLLTQAARVSSDRTVILIVDTGFAGAAIPRTPPGLDHWFVLAATDANSGDASDYPSLSCVLAELLQRGVRECPYPMVTIVDLAQRASEAIRLLHRPRPGVGRAPQMVTWGGSGGVQELGFAYNRQK